MSGARALLRAVEVLREGCFDTEPALPIEVASGLADWLTLVSAEAESNNGFHAHAAPALRVARAVIATQGGDYTCAGCGALAVDDGWQPEGWVHTMMGDDLCPECKDRATRV